MYHHDMKRAYSILNIKAVSETADAEGERWIEGIATTPSADRMGDVVDPLGAKFATPMPLLWQHKHDEPVGWVEFAEPTAEGIPFRARIAKIEEDGKLRDRIDSAWQSVKSGLVRAVSIGFTGLQWDLLPTGGLKFTEWEWLELSLVTIPANQEATLSVVKKFDSEARQAATGHKSNPVVQFAKSASAPAKPQPNSTGTKDMTVKEQLEQARAKHAANLARMKSLTDTAADAGCTLDEEQGEEYDNLVSENASLEKHISRLAIQEKSIGLTAKPIDGSTVEKAAATRGGSIVLKDNEPKGSDFTKFISCLALAKGSRSDALAMAQSRFPNSDRLHSVLKAAVSAGTTTDPAWAAPLVDYTNMSNEFVELLRPQTIIGNLPGLRRVPFNVRMPAQTGGSSVGWVGEGAAKPVSELSFDSILLGFSKVAGIVVASQELLRFSNPSAEAIIRDDLIKQVAQYLDTQFLDPSVTEIAGVRPASILNGVTAIPSSGTTAAAFRADFQALIGSFLATNLSLEDGALIMSPNTALALAMLTNALGQPEFPTINMAGGSYFGMPIVVSTNVPTSTAGSVIVLVKQSEILLADDGQVVIDASSEASLQMDSAPTNNSATPTGTSLVSMFQTNSVAIRAERFINWKRRRVSAVGYISGANYTG